MALAISQAYQDAADAPATLRAYATDLANYRTWCDRHGFQPMPATPEVVGAYLAAAGEGYALPTLRRRVAAIARACGVAGQPLDTKHPAIRETLRGIGRKHGAPARRSAALTTAEVKRLCRACGLDLAGVRDRALFLLGFAGTKRSRGCSPCKLNMPPGATPCRTVSTTPPPLWPYRPSWISIWMNSPPSCRRAVTVAINMLDDHPRKMRSDNCRWQQPTMML